MKRGMQWPIAVGAILACTVVVNVWVAIVASRDEAFAVEPDYYRKAVHFDEEMAQRAASARLAWTVRADVHLAGAQPGGLDLQLTDATGAPISDAAVTVVAMHNARASQPLAATLTSLGGGRYRASLDARRPGEWELRFTVTRGADRFATSVRVDAGPTPPVSQR